MSNAITHRNLPKIAIFKKDTEHYKLNNHIMVELKWHKIGTNPRPNKGL